MLKKFTVKNFKNFEKEFVFDLSNTKNYEFNTDCVKNGIVDKGLIYGVNGCGKTNLGYALFDIQSHSTDSKVPEIYLKNYINASNSSKIAEFTYEFLFDKTIVVYKYGKYSADDLVYENLEINGNTVLSIDWRKSSKAVINLEGSETLDKDLESNNLISNKISLIKYVRNNSKLKNTKINDAFFELTLFINSMYSSRSVELFTTNSSSPYLSFIKKRNKKTDPVKDLELFFNRMGVKLKLSEQTANGKEIITADFGKNKIDIFEILSTGGRGLANLFVDLIVLQSFVESNKRLSKSSYHRPFIYFDEYDAYYHFRAAYDILEIISKIDCQIILSTHNTSVMTNDILRPDCYFIMDNESIKPTFTFTDKELRKAHNIEKMYKAGAF
jgi:AAA15 family ATPase/GTPase